MQMHAGDLLTKRAFLTPNRTALVEVATGRRYTYAELNARANRLANFLREDLGIAGGDCVSILAHNSVAYIDLFYGVAKIGAILAPLNWRLAGKELTYIVNDCRPKALLCGADFVGTLADMRSQIDVPHYVSLEGADIEGATTSYEAGLARASEAEPTPPPLDGETPHCILYSSGTTGRPKGVIIPQRQVLWNCINTVISWGLTEQDVSPVFTPLFHAGGLFAFLTPLFYTGGRIILSRLFEVEETLRVIQEERCTVILGVPTIFQLWLNSPHFAGADFSHVHYFISGGAPCPTWLIEAWREQKGVIFRQGYGLTEVGPNCFSMTDEESIPKTGSVGKPIFHSQMRLVNEQGVDVPVGEVGELAIAGPHLCTGYWQNPEATAQALRDGWFYTGDMARRDEDGFFYIVGRYKDMLISGGENVYAAEVEALFREHPAVAEAALIGQPDETWGEVGLMVVVPQVGQNVTPEELLAFCTGQLARYKIPKRVILTDSLPVSPYGKVLKTELKQQFVTEWYPR
jgi:fatty-acyl-CoA synthase